MSSAKPVLFTYWRSSASWRIRIALNLKNIAYQPQCISLVKDGGEQFSPSFIKLNPSSQVPVLQIDGHSFTESVAILEYLEETRPQPALLPSAPSERAQVRQLVEMINAGIQPKQNLAVLRYVDANFGGEPARLKFAKNFVEKGLQAVEQVLQTTAGKYCVGDRITFADIVLVPQSSSCARFSIDTQQFPTMMRIVKELSELPEFVAAHPIAQPDADL